MHTMSKKLVQGRLAHGNIDTDVGSRMHVWLFARGHSVRLGLRD